MSVVLLISPSAQTDRWRPSCPVVDESKPRLEDVEGLSYSRYATVWILRDEPQGTVSSSIQTLNPLQLSSINRRYPPLPSVASSTAVTPLMGLKSSVPFILNAR